MRAREPVRGGVSANLVNPVSGTQGSLRIVVWLAGLLWLLHVPACSFGPSDADRLAVAGVLKGENLLLNVGTAKTMGSVTTVAKDYFEASLTIPVCGEGEDRVAISRRIGSRWRLIGIGTLKG